MSESQQLQQVLGQFYLEKYEDLDKRVTHGIISSFNPLKNRMGICVIWGNVSSLGQI